KPAAGAAAGTAGASARIPPAKPKPPPNPSVSALIMSCLPGRPALCRGRASARRVELSQMWPSGRQFQDWRLVAGGGNEEQQILSWNGRRCAVGQRMRVDGFVLHQLSVEKWPDTSLRIVDEAEYGDAAGLHAQQFHQHFRLPERHAARGSDQMMDLLEVD